MDERMHPSLIARILVRRARLRRHERWTRRQLEAHQATRLAELRAFAAARSRFYRRFHAGLDGRPLRELPVLTKAMLMDGFDDIVTDAKVRLADVDEHLAALRDDGRFLGRYWVSATSGSSGRRSIVVSDAREWAAIIASYGRANEWSGVRISPLRRARLAVVSSRTPFHQSLRVGQSIATPLVRTCRLDASQPLTDIVRALDAFQPQVLVAYASMITILAEEQLAGRLHIAPAGVSSSSEVLTPEGRARAVEAWGVTPFDVYAATETGGIAAECDLRRGMHLFEDLVIPEVVDDDHRPVPDGTAGARLLVTVLHSRTLPLIRYELTDRLKLATEPCPCGRPFRLVAAIEGRTDDVMELAAEGGAGTVRVHPVVFHRALDLVRAAGWQVRQEPDAIRVAIQAPQVELDTAALSAAIAQGLSSIGAAAIPVRVEVVPSIPAGAAGKRPLVVALKAPAASRPA
jgi:putative adenylate-forming enzyme